MIHLNSKSSIFSVLLCAWLATASVAVFADESGIPPSETERVASTPTDPNAAVKTMPPGWNGNLCDDDSVRLCLGVQGLGRDAWVRCMREHYAQLTPDCQEVMAPSNFKTPLQGEETPTAKAAPSLFGH